MKELGGDEEDFQLLQTVESEDKKKPEEAAFTETDQKELTAFIKSLNLKKYSVSVVPDGKVEEEEKDSAAVTKVAKVEKPVKEKKKEKGAVTKVQDSEVSSTTTTTTTTTSAVVVEEEPTRTGPEFHFVKTTPNRGHCVIRSNEKWYAATTASATEPVAAGAESAKTVNLPYWLPKIEKYAQLAWDLEIKNYEEARKRGKREDSQTI